MRKIGILIILMSIANLLAAQANIEFSKAGYLSVPKSGREVFDFNVGWRFLKADIKEAYKVEFDDSQWGIVNCPHGLELVPSEASGGINYQGPAWYRKHFSPADSLKGKQIRIHFEGVMGKCKVWLNGELITEHFGGYLPFSADLTKKLNFGKKNILVVLADNSDDPTYPPGKPQATLDFAYFGGIYRDVWLTSTNSVFVSNANDEDIVAGGGLLIRSENITTKTADVLFSAHVRNASLKKQNIKAVITLKSQDGKIVSKQQIKTTINANGSETLPGKFTVKAPNLWSPQAPNLYKVEVVIFNNRNQKIDGIAQNIGIRKLEMRGKDGFWLNGKPYPKRLIGVNRHQDFAYIGNALPNNGQWRDAKLLKDAGCDIVRAAHYPVDPAFMEACDVLGMFYIVATPGWQFWNNEPIFEQRVYSNVKNMMRRDRNHPSVIMWEPILNETWYPDHFAKKVHDIVHNELPGESVFTVCDNHVKGQEYFDVVYAHPFKGTWFQNPILNTLENRTNSWLDYESEKRCVFTREFGDFPDDWSAHNSPSRIARSWGEHGQLVQLHHYENPNMVYASWESLHQAPKQHIGGALWHSFDHQRGYHPDPFYGGITDVFRQKKYSYYLFESQKAPETPMIYIAHDMNPMSEPDITVLTNCDEVRLIIYETDTLYAKSDKTMKMPHPVVRFNDVYDFIDVKRLHGKGQQAKASIVAEGLIDGKVVVSHKRMASKRETKILLEIQDQSIPMVANGSDIAVVVASIVDEDGIVKRLVNGDIKFEIEGDGELIGNASNSGNPRKVEWGSAAILVRSSTKSGLIRIKASMLKEGIHVPESAIIEIKTIPSHNNFIFNEQGKYSYGNIKFEQLNSTKKSESDKDKQIEKLKKEIVNLKLKEVERQQDDFQAR